MASSEGWPIWCPPTESQQDPDEAELLPYDRKHEIGVLLRQKGEALLGALGVAGTEPAARADRDPALNGMIAGRPRVHLGIEKGQQPVLLVRGQPFPEREGHGPHGHVEEPDEERIGQVRPPDEEQGGERDDPRAPGPVVEREEQTQARLLFLLASPGLSLQIGRAHV